MKKLLTISLVMIISLLMNTTFAQYSLGITADTNFPNINTDIETESGILLNNNYPKHSIDIGISYRNNSNSGTSIKIPGVDLSTGGISGKLTYNFYPNQRFAFNFSAGAMAVDVKAWALNDYTIVIVPLMMGMKYYLVHLSQGYILRPYLTGSMGVLLGRESSTKILSIKKHNESAVGGYGGVGSDIVLGRLIKLQAELGYNIFSDFSNEIGSRKNYSGLELSFGIGFMF